MEIQQIPPKGGLKKFTPEGTSPRGTDGKGSLDRYKDRHPEDCSTCEDEHCLIHQVDEPSDLNTYDICLECNHVYQTPEDLLAAYRANYSEEEQKRLKFKKPEQITYCPYCLHNF